MDLNEKIKADRKRLKRMLYAACIVLLLFFGSVGYFVTEMVQAVHEVGLKNIVGTIWEGSK